MVLQTKLTHALGIVHPVVQGGMHHVGFASLAAAVSNAGGLGLITALTQKTPEDLRKEIQKCRELTDKPFGVNLTVIPALNDMNQEKFAKVIMEEGITVIETAGSPKCAEFWTMFKKYNPDTIILHKCVSTRHALKAQNLGVDFISLDGFECGGHPGEEDVGNYVLQALGNKRLDVPFITSGGVGEGSQLAAALALGAEGVNMGTRFIATKESPVQDGIKQALVKADERNTTLVLRSLKNTERVYKNKTTDEVQKLEAEYPGDISKIIHLVKGDNYRKSFLETGNEDDSVWSAGQVMGLIDDVPTCKDLIERMVADAEAIMSSRLPSMVK